MLLDAGANLHVRTTGGGTPLQIAERMGDGGMMRALLDARSLCVAFAMAQHPRLGAGAEAGGLEAGLAREVLALAGVERPPGPPPPLVLSGHAASLTPY
jgi:ankyrin repeat protein